MRRPNSLLKGTELEAYLTKEQEYHQHALTKHISRYEKKCFIENLKELIRTIEEFINLQLEIDNDEDLQLFLAFDNSNFSFSISQINVICNRLEKQFDQGVINRLKSIMLMNIALYNGYKISGMHESIYQKIKDNKHAILYYQSNRKNYIDLLTLGYNYCQGKIKFPFIDTLNQIQYTVDTCFGCIINAYYNRLSYYCLDNFSIDYSFDPYKASYHFENLDNLYLEPQRLGLIEQGEFTSALENYIPKKNKRNELIFDFVEVYIALELLEDRKSVV